MGKKEKKKGSIKKKILATIVPLVAITVVILIFVTTLMTRQVITNMTTNVIVSEAMKCSANVNSWTGKITAELNMVKNSIDTDEFDIHKLDKLLQRTTYNKNSSYKNGVYIGDADNNYVDASNWKPDKEYQVKERAWYKEGLMNDTIMLGASYIDAQTNSSVVAATCKLKNGNNAVMSADITLSQITAMIAKMTFLDSGKTILIDVNKKEVLADSNEKVVGKPLSDCKEDKLYQNMDSILTSVADTEEIKGNNGTYITHTEKIVGTNWVVITYIPKIDVFKNLVKLQLRIVILSAISILVIMIVVERMIHYMIKPLKRMSDVIDEVAMGDFTKEIQIKGNDEIANIGTKIKELVSILRMTMVDIHANSNLIYNKSENSTKVSNELHQLVTVQQESMSELKNTVNELTNAVNEIAENATALALFVNETQDNSEQVADQMRQTVDISGKGKEGMLEITGAMNDVKISIKELSNSINQVGDSVKQIDEITQLILDISEQTNLLALNASIEAARAGEAGKGFAVVAGEIGQLADSTSDAVKKILTVTKSIQDVVHNTSVKAVINVNAIDESSCMIENAAENFDEIYETIKVTNQVLLSMGEKIEQVSDATNSVAAITEEQAAGAEEILATAETISDNADSVRDNSNLVAEDAVELNQIAEQLQQQMKKFKL